MRRYLQAVAAPIALVVLVVGLLGGGTIALGLLVLLVLLGLGSWVLFGTDRRAADLTCTRVGGPDGPEVGVAPVAAAGPGAPAQARAGRGSVALSLARVEGRELVASPWFGLGMGFWLIIMVAFGFVFEDDNERGWWFFFGLSSMLANPFAGLVVVTVHRNATRSRRDGCDELFDTCPADADARSLGLLLTAWIPALVSTALLSALALMVAAGNPRMFGPIDHETAAALVAAGVLGGGAVALGTTLGRWAPWAVVPILAVVAVAFLDGVLNGIGRPSWATDRYLATALAPPDVDLIFTTRPVWWRVVWLLALSVLVGSLAFVAGRRPRAARLAAGCSALVAVVAAVLVVRPGRGSEVDRVASLVTDAPAHQTCRRAGPEVRVCAYRPYARAADLAARQLEPVVAAVPPGVLAGIVVRQRFAGPLAELQPEVVDRIGDRRSASPPSELRLRFNLHPDNLRAARLRLAARAARLPTEAGPGGRPVVVAGQARGVVALWLATRGLDRAQALRFVADGTASGSEPADATDIGSIWPGACHDEAAALVWAPRDLVATRLLLDLPTARVQAVIGEGWDLATDPASTTDDLLRLVGLELGGVTETIEPRPLSCG